MIHLKYRLFIMLGFIFLVFSNLQALSSPESFEVSPMMKNKIMQSSLKAKLETSDQKKITAYLYAENEQSEPWEYSSCIDGEPKNVIFKKGDYYLYYYDNNTGLFLKKRIKIFDDSTKSSFGWEGSRLILLSGKTQKESDVLLISQFVNCGGDFFEAYGFSKDNLSPEQYYFRTAKRKKEQFYGRLSGAMTPQNLLSAYGFYDDDKEQHRISVSLSNQHGIVQLTQND